MIRSVSLAPLFSYRALMNLIWNGSQTKTFVCLSVCSKCLSVALSHPVRPVLGLTSDRQLSFDRRKTTRATDQLMERKPTVETLNTCSVFNCRAGHATTRPCFQAKRMVEYCLMSIFVLATLFTRA